MSPEESQEESQGTSEGGVPETYTTRETDPVRKYRNVRELGEGELNRPEK